MSHRRVAHLKLLQTKACHPSNSEVPNLEVPNLQHLNSQRISATTTANPKSALLHSLLSTQEASAALMAERNSWSKSNKTSNETGKPCCKLHRNSLKSYQISRISLAGYPWCHLVPQKPISCEPCLKPCSSFRVQGHRPSDRADRSCEVDPRQILAPAAVQLLMPDSHASLPGAAAWCD